MHVCIRNLKSFSGSRPAPQHLLHRKIDFLGQLNQGQCTKHERLFEPFVQTAIQKRLQQVLIVGLKKNASKKSVDPHVIAAAASWAIYGAVVQWVHAENRAPAESFADVALQLVGPMLHLPAGGRHVPAARESKPARAKAKHSK